MKILKPVGLAVTAITANNAKLILTLVVATLFLGCAVQKDFIPDGGSRADGIVKLSFFYGDLQAPTYSMDQGLILAKRRCASWGYLSAEAFGTIRTRCQYHKCTSTAEFQCLDSANAISPDSKK